MDWLTFFSSLVNSTAWPISIVLIVWWLKDYIKKLIPYTSKFKYGELEIEFGKELEELKNEKDKLQKEQPTETITNTNNAYVNKDSLETSPRTIIIESWVALEFTAFSNAKHYKLIDSDKHIPLMKVLKLYEEKQVLQKEEIKIIHKLQQLRNQAVHEISFEISYNEAEEYSKLAREMEETIISECWKLFGGCSR